MITIIVGVVALLVGIVVGSIMATKDMRSDIHEMSLNISSLRDEVNGLMNTFWLSGKERESISESWMIHPDKSPRMSDIHGVV